MAAESKLQTRIRKNLEKNWYVVKVSICNKPGFPDLMALNAGRTMFFEIKSAGKKAKPLQEHRHTELRDRGFQVFVIDTWEQYLHIRSLLG